MKKHYMSPALMVVDVDTEGVMDITSVNDGMPTIDDPNNQFSKKHNTDWEDDWDDDELEEE